MTTCKDPNDQTQRNAAALAPLPNTTASDGTLLPSFATAALENYTSLVSADIGLTSQNNTPINRFVRQYGQEAFNAGLVAINNTLINKETFQDNLPNYPQLETRLNTLLPITPIEYANYMNEFLQTPLTVATLVNLNPALVQSQLNDYYRNNFTQSAIGSFCSLMPSVFGAIGGFFNLVEDAQQAFQDITDFINNFSLKDFSIKAIMKKLIGQIKEQILKVVDDMVSKVKGIIENLSFENIIGQIETIVNDRIIARFISLRAEALAFFSKENIQNLKKKIENLFNYAASIFKDPSLEEIQFLVYRFCAFAGQIENAIDLLKKPLDDFINSYQDTYQILKSYGSVATSEAVVTGGAIRYTDEERKRKIEQGKQKEQRQPPDELGRPTAPPAGITTEEWSDAQSISTFEAVQADPRFIVENLAREEWEALFTNGTQGEVVARLIRLQKLFAEETGIKTLRVVDAYRSPEEQRRIWISYRARTAGSKEAAAAELDTIIRDGLRNPLSGSVALPGRSAHQSARAFDINWIGFNRETVEIFCVLAKNKCGFNGFGIYSVSGSGAIVHIDTRSNAVWGGARNEINFNRRL